MIHSTRIAHDLAKTGLDSTPPTTDLLFRPRKARSNDARQFPGRGVQRHENANHLHNSDPQGTHVQRKLLEATNQSATQGGGTRAAAGGPPPLGISEFSTKPFSFPLPLAVAFKLKTAYDNFLSSNSAMSLVRSRICNAPANNTDEILEFSFCSADVAPSERTAQEELLGVNGVILRFFPDEGDSASVATTRGEVWQNQGGDRKT